MKSREGLTVVEAAVAIAAIGLILALLVPAVLASRESARRGECASHMRQIGTALASYHQALNTFPPGLIATLDQAGFDEYAGANSMMLPYLEQEGLYARYDRNRAWYRQSPEVAQTIVAVFVCPSVSQANPFEIPLLASDPNITTGGTYALTNYLFSKGLNDAWCSPPGTVPVEERGMFDVNVGVSDAVIRDGLSHTIAVGEGAGGPHWPLCGTPGCDTAAAADPAGNRPHASVPWLATTIYPDFVAASGYLASSQFACTLEPLNKKPITHSMVSVGSIADCRCSLNGGHHHTSNFRSDHPGGANFLFADGSMHFLHHAMDITTYRRLSTVSDGAVAEIP